MTLPGALWPSETLAFFDEGYTAGTGTFVDSKGNAANLTEATAGDRPSWDTTTAPSGRGMLSFPGGGTHRLAGGQISTGLLPAYGTGFWVDFYLVKRNSSGGAIDDERIVDYDGSDSIQINYGKVYRLQTYSDAVRNTDIMRVVVVTNAATNVVTQYINNVAQADLGATDGSAFGIRAQLAGLKYIGNRNNRGAPYGGLVGCFGYIHRATFGSTEIAALDAAMDEWWSLSPLPPGSITGSTTATLTPTATMTAMAALSGTAYVGLRLATVPSVTRVLRTYPGRLDRYTLFGLPSNATTLVQTELFGPAAVGSGAITGTTTVSLAPTATATGRTSLTASSTLALTPSASLTGTGALSGASTLALALSAAVGGTSPIDGTATLGLTPTGTLLGRGAVTGATAATLAPTATLRGLVDLTGTASAGLSATATLLGRGAITGASTLTFALAAAAGGTVPITGSSTLSLAPTATATGRGLLGGATTLALALSAAVGGTSPITGAATVSLAPTATLLARGALVGAATASLAPVAILRGLVSVTGSSTLEIAAAAVLRGIVQIVGSTTAGMSASGLVTGRGLLAGTTSTALSPSGTLLGRGELAGMTGMSFALDGTVYSVVDIQGMAHLALTATGDIVNYIPLNLPYGKLTTKLVSATVASSRLKTPKTTTTRLR